jgi:hypothetical protein
MSNNYICKIIKEQSLINFLIELDLPDKIFTAIPYFNISVPARSKYEPLIPVDIDILYLLLMFIHLLSKSVIRHCSYTTTL